MIQIEGWRRAGLFRHGLPALDQSVAQHAELDRGSLVSGHRLLETTNLSVGRGTNTPFELDGGAVDRCRRLAAELNAADLAGVRFVPLLFLTGLSKFKGERCGGVNILITNRELFEPLRTGFALAFALRKLYPQQWRRKTTDGCCQRTGPGRRQRWPVRGGDYSFIPGRSATVPRTGVGPCCFINDRMPHAPLLADCCLSLIAQSAAAKTPLPEFTGQRTLRQRGVGCLPAPAAEIPAASSNHRHRLTTSSWCNRPALANGPREIISMQCIRPGLLRRREKVFLWIRSEASLSCWRSRTGSFPCHTGGVLQTQYGLRDQVLDRQFVQPYFIPQAKAGDYLAVCKRYCASWIKPWLQKTRSLSSRCNRRPPARRSWIARHKLLSNRRINCWAMSARS